MIAHSIGVLISVIPLRCIRDRTVAKAILALLFARPAGERTRLLIPRSGGQRRITVIRKAVCFDDWKDCSPPVPATSAHHPDILARFKSKQSIPHQNIEPCTPRLAVLPGSPRNMRHCEYAELEPTGHYGRNAATAPGNLKLDQTGRSLVYASPQFGSSATPAESRMARALRVRPEAWTARRRGWPSIRPCIAKLGEV